MTRKSWCLWGRDERMVVDPLHVDAAQVEGASGPFEVSTFRCRGGLSDGVDVVRVDNGRLAVDLLPTRGMGLWRGTCDGLDLGWNSPVAGPVHPAYVPLADPSGLGWLDGFDEWLVRCGLESNGAPEFDGEGRLSYPLHGRIANRAAQRVDLTVDGESGQIELTGVVDEVRFHFSKLRLHSTVRTAIGQPYLEIEDRIENLSASPGTAQMLYHINFGPPLLEPAAQVIAPVATLVPRTDHAARAVDRWDRYDPPQAGLEEQVYFFELQHDRDNATRVLLRNADASRGASVAFRTDQLPCFTLWKNQTAEADGYVTGLEPATNFPNPHGFERAAGRIVTLPPLGSYTINLRLDVHSTPASVREAEDQISRLAEQAPEIHHAPQSAWCA